VPGPNPSFVYWPITQTGQNLATLAGGFDWNGDGRGDVALGSQDWDRVIGSTTVGNVGGFEIILGRSPLAGIGTRTQMICTPDVRVLGLLANDNLGRAIAAVGDVDGDGCSELAVGASGEDLGRTDQGTVRVLFGAGPACATSTLRVLTFTSGEQSALGGIAMGGGGDVDGDGLPDLVVGGTGHKRGSDTVGIAWLLRGARLRALAPQAEQLIDNATPGLLFALVDPSDPTSLFLEGGSIVDRIGNGVSLVRRAAPSTQFDIVVGASGGGPAGVLLSGGARVHEFGPSGLDPFPVVVVGGETTRTGSLLGELVRGGSLAGVPMILVGGIQGYGGGPDEGAAYSGPILPR
jgi:hypothetical protein